MRSGRGSGAGVAEIGESGGRGALAGRAGGGVGAGGWFAQDSCSSGKRLLKVVNSSYRLSSNTGSSLSSVDCELNSRLPVLVLNFMPVVLPMTHGSEAGQSYSTARPRSFL